MEDGIRFEQFCLNAGERLLTEQGVRVAISSRALDLLIALTERAGEVVSAQDLLARVWPDTMVEEGNLRVQVAALRKVLKDGKSGSRYILTVAGRGYAFVAPVERFAGDVATPAASQPTTLTGQRPPELPTAVVGRAEAIEALALMLLSRRFVSVIGPGGIGKTTIALAVAHAVLQNFDDAVHFVDLGPLSLAALVPTAIASAIGCTIQGPDPEGCLTTFLAQKRLLIVVDSCEHLVEAIAPLIERLFRGAPGVHFLTTSREALRVDGENVHALAPLSLPKYRMPSATQALGSPAVQLFMDRARASGYRNELSNADAPVVADICRRMDGIALAIELAASRVGSYGIRGTAELLDGANILVLPGSRSQPPRHKTMHAALDWSFMLLSRSEQRVFNWLSVFVGPFTSKAAMAVVGSIVPHDVFHALTSLADKSLIAVSWADGGMFYRLLDTTRSFAGEKLSDSGESHEASRCHASYLVEYLKEEAKEAVFKSGNIASYMPHMGNIRRALTWCFSSVGDYIIGARLAAHAAPLFLAGSLLDECRSWSRRGLDSLHEMDRGTSLELELQEALAISLVFTGGDIESTRKALERGLELSAALRATRHQTNLISALYIFLTRQGDIKGALAAVEQSATIVSALGRPSEQAMTQWILASAHHMAGHQAIALRHCEDGFKIKANWAPGQINFFGYDHKARGLTVYARSLWLCGFPDQACKVIRQGTVEIEKLDHSVSKCVFLLFTAPILLWSGLHNEAIENTNRAVEQTVASSLAPYYAVGLALKGEHLAGNGDPASGVVMLREALRTMDQLRFHIMTLETLRALAEALAAAGRPEEALETIGEALARARRGGEALWLPNLLRSQGEILLAQSDVDLDAAETVLEGAVEAARRQAATSWELKASVPLARVLARKGHVSEARSMLGAIYAQFDEGFGTPDLVMARRLLSEWGYTA